MTSKSWSTGMRATASPGANALGGLALLGVVASVALAEVPTTGLDRPAAHEIPADVTVLAFVKPEGERLRVLVRVPLEAMRDVQFPLTGPGYVDVEAARPRLPEVARLWVADYLEVRADGRSLEAPAITATRLTLPNDRSFGTYEEAIAHISGGDLDASARIHWQQALLDISLEYRIVSEDADFSIVPEWAHLGIRTRTVLRFLPAAGGERAFQYEGDPGLVRLDPRWHQAALGFVRLGFLHILGGLDHLLFVLCLVIPFRRFGALVPVVTSFTVAHSITLVASAFGFAPTGLWFPPLIETLIALSIVFMALENIVGARAERRWLFAFAFGLVHGFGFSFLLRDSLQFAGAHLATSLLAFNVGVELGQLLVIAAAIPVLELLFRRSVSERLGTIVLSALVAHEAWHWMTGRGSELMQFRFRWPGFTIRALADLMRWTALALGIAGVAWVLFGVFARWQRRQAPSPAGSVSEPASGGTPERRVAAD